MASVIFKEQRFIFKGLAMKMAHPCLDFESTSIWDFQEKRTGEGVDGERSGATWKVFASESAVMGRLSGVDGFLSPPGVPLFF